MVADILQLAEVVAGHQNGGATLGHVAQQQRPHLTAHDGVKAVHRFVQDQVFRHAAHGDPEGRLLLHTLAHTADHLAVVQREHLVHFVVALLAEGGVHALVESGHLPDGPLGEIEPVVRNDADALLDGGVFVDGLALQRQRAAVGTVDAGEMADDGGFSRAVGAYQTVDRTLGDGQAGFVQGAEAVKGLDDVLCF